MICPFCNIPDSRINNCDDYSFVIRDGFPVSPGHTLIIPRRHVGSFFLISDNEQDSLLKLINVAKVRLDEEFCPAGFNIGINEGAAAGQTVPHLHIHLIPRYLGDCSDPRGGIRWIIPEKADYWTR